MTQTSFAAHYGYLCSATAAEMTLYIDVELGNVGGAFPNSISDIEKYEP